MVKVTLIVPVYNQQELVIRALNSIPKRDDIEVIIIDDGSTDKTLEVCTNWVKNCGIEHIKLISYKENKGLGHAKNVGYDNATGEYINELDSDDYLYPNEYECVINELDGTDIVYMDFRVNEGSTLIFDETSKTKLGSGCARFIKREFLGETRCPEVRYAEDWHLSNELNNKNPTEKYTHIVGYHYNTPRKGSLCYEAYQKMKSEAV